MIFIIIITCLSMKRIKLTESQLHTIIREAVSRVINEDKEDHGDFYDGVAWVKNGEGKYNYVNKQNQLICQEWFDDAMDFRDGVGVVRRKNKWNFVNGLGELISRMWFDDVHYSSEGYAAVKVSNNFNPDNIHKWNYINHNGKFISKNWFDWCGWFENGYGEVKIGDKYGYIDTNGETPVTRRKTRETGIERV